MANIKTYLNNIKTAVFGSEVRDSIHDAIQQCYDDASAKDNANMEVKMARGEYENLGKRLDSHSSQIKDIENKKAGKSDIFTMANMGQDIKEAMTGGSVAVVGINAVTNENVLDGSLSIEKMDIIDKSLNMLNMETSVHGYINSSGVFTDDDTVSEYSRVSDFIRVDYGTKYCFLTTRSDKTFLYKTVSCVYYDSSKNFIKKVNVPANITTIVNIEPVENAYYVKLVFNHENPEALHIFGYATDFSTIEMAKEKYTDYSVTIKEKYLPFKISDIENNEVHISKRENILNNTTLYPFDDTATIYCETDLDVSKMIIDSIVDIKLNDIDTSKLYFISDLVVTSEKVEIIISLIDQDTATPLYKVLKTDNDFGKLEYCKLKITDISSGEEKGEIVFKRSAITNDILEGSLSLQPYDTLISAKCYANDLDNYNAVVINEGIDKVCNLPFEHDTFSFVCVSDIHYTGKKSILNIAQASVDIAERTPVDALVCLGDQIPGNIIKNRSLKQMRDITNVMAQTKKDFYCIKGNHDTNNYNTPRDYLFQ